MSPTALVAGCGDLGTEVGLRFAAEGWRVLGLRRSPDRLPEPIEPVAADLTGPLDGLGDALPTAIDALVYTPTAGERSESAYRSVYRDGLQRLLDELDATGRPPRRLLAVSSTAVYGTDDGSDVDEDTPTSPTSATGRVLVEAEEAFHARRADAVCLRLAGIYGPGRTGLIDRVRHGEAVVPAAPVLTNRIHRDDAAAAIVHLLVHVRDLAPIYLGVDEAPVDRGEVIRFLAAELGLPDPPIGEVRRGRGGNKRCSNQRLVATGFTFAYPTYREGYRAVLTGEGVRHR
jgi:nucleoside-diphosphate-sugar epimerase